jgi:2-oxoisovalerate dehydrogenase E1 component
MPKSITIHPYEQRKAGLLELSPIPINQYQKTVLDEKANYTNDEMVRIYRDMLLIRRFETMLQIVKTQREFAGVPYDHKGPAHLSIGQEAAAVGQAFLLGVDDHIYGSHRSHGEILAKGLSAIEKLPAETLISLMENYNQGRTLKGLEMRQEGKNLSTVKTLAIDFLLYGTLAEIFGRETGFNCGMGGSMHAFFTPFGVYPNNAIVGGSADIAVGAALYKRVNQKPGIVIANIGDASANCGPTWEALCFATMEQFKTLWGTSEGAHKGGLPIIVNFVNNFYGMGGQPVGETGGFQVLARMGVGLNPEQMHTERVDGYNPLAIIDAIRRKKALLESGSGPVLLDTVTYRFSGHSPSDQSSYREKDEMEEWQKVDSLLTYRAQLLEAKATSEEELNMLTEQVEEIIIRAYKAAVDYNRSPRADLYAVGNLLERTMYSQGNVPNLEPGRTPDSLLPEGTDPRTKSLESKSRSGLDASGAKIPETRCIGVKDALFEAIRDAFYTDPTLVAYGEENRDWGGAFGVYRGLTESLPYHRLFNSPISEAAIVGTAVGYALEGGRPLVELMYCDFMGRAGDEIFNQMAKWQSMSGGMLQMPVVLRVSVGSKYGAQHSQDWTALCAHIPGLKVVFPSTPYDAKGLMASALQGTDPVVFFESQRLYNITELFHGIDGVPVTPYTVPIGTPEVKREGSDLTILSIGATLYRALDTADILQSQYNLSTEIIDARSLVPFDYTLVLESVKKTGKILLVSDACERGSFLHTMATKISQFAFDHLDAPPMVIGARNWITPPDEIEEAFFPFPADMLDAIHTYLQPLDGYQLKRVNDPEALLARNKMGI